MRLLCRLNWHDWSAWFQKIVELYPDDNCEIQSGSLLVLTKMCKQKDCQLVKIKRMKMS